MLVLSACQLYAQDRAAWQDSLQKALPAHVADTAKVNLLNKLAASYIQTNLDSMFSLAQQAKSLAEQLKYSSGIGDATVQIAMPIAIKAITHGFGGISPGNRSL